MVLVDTFRVVRFNKLEAVERLDVQTVSIEEKSGLRRCFDHCDCNNEEPLSADLT